jgi:flagellar biosynthesis protein FlhG
MGVNPVQVIAVTGGKGGVGKTTVAINLAVAMAALGRRVMLLDADLSLGSIDVQLGLQAGVTLADVLGGSCELQDILIAAPGGIRVLPAAAGARELTRLSAAQYAGLIQAFSALGNDVDVLIVDTAPGISDGVLSFVRAAHEVLVVACDEPASIADAYALISLLNRDFGISRFRILAGMAYTPQEGRSMFLRLNRLTDRFLDVALHFAGSVPFDESVRKAIQRQRAVCEAFPRSKSALAFKSLALKADGWALPTTPRGHLEFFLESLLTGSGKSGA